MNTLPLWPSERPVPLTSRLLMCALLLSFAPPVLAQEQPFSFQYDPHVFWQEAPAQADEQLRFIRHRVDLAEKLGWLSHDRAQYYYRRLDKVAPIAAAVRASREPTYTKRIDSSTVAVRGAYGADLGTAAALKAALRNLAQGLAEEVRHNQW